MNINRDYPCDASNYLAGRRLPVTYLVIHYVGAFGSALANVKYYGGTSGIKASAHFYVGHADEGAAVYRSVDPADTAWHCGGGLQGSGGHAFYGQCLNANSIGIELCCHQDENGTWYFDAETVDTGVKLVKELMAQYGINSDRVIRHYDVTGKNCPAPFVENVDEWETFKARLMETEETEMANSVPSDWAQEVAEWATENGLIKGDENGDCKWQDPLTREQAMVIFKRFSEKFGS